MDSYEAVKRVIEVLAGLDVPYMLVGAFSCNAYAYPRSTKDADFVVNLADGDLDQIIRQLGTDFRLDRQLQFETITGSLRNIVTYLPRKFDIELFRLNPDPHHAVRFERKVERQLVDFGSVVWIPTAEDVVIQKLRWRRDKDVIDARNVIQVQFDKLDWEYVRRWTDEHETTALLDQLRAEAEG